MTDRRADFSDISDGRWALIEPTLAARQQARIDRRPTGEPSCTDIREVFNAMLYVDRTGISWKCLPHDFPPHSTVYYYALWYQAGAGRWEPIAGPLDVVDYVLPSEAEASFVRQCAGER